MATAIETAPKIQEDFSDVIQPIAGEPAGKNLLSMHQLSESDIYDYIDEARAAEAIVQKQNGINLLPFRVLKAVMRQPSTRTGGSMTTAMAKLGGSGQLISGTEGSAEAKGEKVYQSWEAFATQSDILGIRMAEDWGPAQAAQAIAKEARKGSIPNVPVINLGDGKNEHPTQALGDLFTIHQEFGRLENLTMAVVGDYARYRAFHSLLIGAAAVGINVIAVESEAAPVPQELVELLGPKLERTDDLDEAIKAAEVLYMGRNPDEYTGELGSEKLRSRQLVEAYKNWVINYGRLQQMRPDGKLMHPRPINGEIHPSVEKDQRVIDVKQMHKMIPMRMAIIARHLGKSIQQELQSLVV